MSQRSQSQRARTCQSQSQRATSQSPGDVGSQSHATWWSQTSQSQSHATRWTSSQRRGEPGRRDGAHGRRGTLGARATLATLSGTSCQANAPSPPSPLPLGFNTPLLSHFNGEKESRPSQAKRPSFPVPRYRQSPTAQHPEPHLRLQYPDSRPHAALSSPRSNSPPRLATRTVWHRSAEPGRNKHCSPKAQAGSWLPLRSADLAGGSPSFQARARAHRQLLRASPSEAPARFSGAAKSLLELRG